MGLGGVHIVVSCLYEVNFLIIGTLPAAVDESLPAMPSAAAGLSIERPAFANPNMGPGLWD